MENYRGHFYTTYPVYPYEKYTVEAEIFDEDSISLFLLAEFISEIKSMTNF